MAPKATNTRSSDITHEHFYSAALHRSNLRGVETMRVVERGTMSWLPQPTRASARPAAALKVLHVDGHGADRGLIDEVIDAAAGLAVISTGSGLDALDLACTERPSVVVLDGDLPDASVDQIVYLLKTDPITANVPVIVFTDDDTDRAFIDRLGRLGADVCLPKPLDLDADLDELIATIRLFARPRPMVSALVPFVVASHDLASAGR